MDRFHDPNARPPGVPDDAIPLHHGLLVMRRADLHPDPEPELVDTRLCGICGSIAWATAVAMRYLDMNPWVPVLCCTCAELAEGMLREAVPGTEFMYRDVPDLAKLGTFN